ncbi:hypothetical protein FK949_gp038 [Paramecium bursaria Chlorella virus NYs1]|uniref:Uncharacterized protein n=1 Tax=Paramecium bursaria Chlorella virus NYs1 TaxID=83442 RepID=M1HH56_9PHYC|nr:hypothetical protein AR158_C102L [Paramecium bursaria Chlorella virus AR158]YP_009665248.1 hypothetical protein FK949_gp038 [Paramecium bursaria Chlorella virus NYs1]ABU43648.1 hypothetical protein AR158_C102L [Paramecium bursaria Chlorella virus AR158]AGE54124.1 hypothetical protein PBCVIL52s1_171R [Paramecium bursaria Chlorella virus IL-5-2s1]AGE58603.1 hypothetical protein PBCVNYs1_103L [Paramecium bursaria Chlorella virus NYs1]
MRFQMKSVFIHRPIYRPMRISTVRRVSPMSTDIINSFGFQSIVTSGIVLVSIMSMGIIHLAEKSVKSGRDFDDSGYDADDDTYDE